jgi:hypothetical protein
MPWPRLRYPGLRALNLRTARQPYCSFPTSLCPQRFCGFDADLAHHERLTDVARRRWDEPNLLSFSLVQLSFSKPPLDAHFQSTHGYHHQTGWD